MVALLGSLALAWAVPGAAADTEPGPAAPMAPAAAQAAPAAAAAPVAVPLANAGFEALPPEAGSAFPGWVTMQHAGEKSYEFSLDETVAIEGRRSLRIVNVGREPFGLVAQRLDAREVRGRRVRASAAMRLQGVAGRGASLNLRAERSGAIVAHEFMRDRRLRGDREWQRVVIEMAVPADASEVELSAVLQGTGTLWVDDVRLEVVGP